MRFIVNRELNIKDNGRGIPHGEHKPGCSTLQACFGEAHTGGKFDKNAYKKVVNAKKQNDEIENKCKEKIQNMFSKDVIEYFESIN
mgnify:CR=1 FL=1